MALITDNDCHAIVEKWFTESKVRILDYGFVPKDVSMGFMGGKQTLCLRVEHDGQVKELQLFVKTLPDGNDFINDYVRRNKCAQKEHTFYSEIAEHLRSHLCDKVFPVCFVSRENEVMIMEDLIELGYRTRGLREFFDGEHCEKALESVAALHAASLAWEEVNGTRLNLKYPDLMTESYYERKDENPGFEHLTTSIRAIKMILDEYFNDRPRELIAETLKVFDGLPELLKPSDKFRNVLSHGDLWCNNIMFPEDSKVKAACLIDFQLIRYSPPALDVLTLIHLNTEREWRELNKDKLLRHYYKTLQTKLASAGLDLKRLIPWREFLDSRNEVEPAALAISSLFLHFVLIKEEEVLHIFNCQDELEKFMKKDRNSIIRKSINDDLHYRQRVLGALSDLLDYLSKKM